MLMSVFQKQACWVHRRLLNEVKGGPLSEGDESAIENGGFFKPACLTKTFHCICKSDNKVGINSLKYCACVCRKLRSPCRILRKGWTNWRKTQPSATF